MDKLKDKKVLGIIALMVVVVVFISLLVINNNKTDEEPNTTLTIEKAGTFVLGDQYEEVIINVPDVVLEDGTVDKILVAKSVGDGEVTFNNVNATELKLEGGGPNSIIISGDSTIKAVRLERVDGAIRVVVTDSSNVETVTAYEGSQDVILEGTFNDLAIEASNINVSIKNSTVKSLSVSGNSSKITVDESAELDDVTILAKADEASLIMNGRAKKIVVESKNSTIDLNKGSVDTIDVKDDAENTTIILGEKATVKTLTTNIPTTVNGDGKLDEIVTDIADNVQGTAKADKVTLTKEPEEDDTKPKPEVSKPAPKPDPKPTPTFDGAKAAGTLTSDTVINIAAIAGVTFPVNGATPVTTITETAQYTGTVSWATFGGEPVLTEGKFAASTYYIATITLTPKAGFTLTGVSANFFTVAGGAATNAANAGVVTANFPATAADVEITAFDAIDAVDGGTAGSATYADAAAVQAALPATATANDTAVTVPVTAWVDTDSYNPAVAGSYTFTATLGTIPAGFANIGGYTATVEVVVATPAIDTESELQAAVANGGTVTLGGNITLSSALIVNETVTLDLNGYTIDTSNGVYVSGECTGVITVDGGNLTIEGGTVDGIEYDDYAVEVRGGGTVTINGGTFKGSATAVQASLGNVYINGGSFEANPVLPQYQGTGNGYQFTLNCIDANYNDGTAIIEVTAGTFYMFNPGDNLSEVPLTNYLAPGYQATADGDNYVVSETPAADQAAADAVDALIAALPAAGEVTLEDQDDIEAARAAYEALTPAQQALVANVEALEAAEDELAVLLGAETAQDNLDIASAKGAIEGAPYTAAQADVADATAAGTKAQALVDALGAALEGTTVVVVPGVFTAATAGDATTPEGTNGSFKFTVTINKGSGTEVTSAEQTMTITATPYEAP